MLEAPKPYIETNQTIFTRNNSHESQKEQNFYEKNKANQIFCEAIEHTVESNRYKNMTKKEFVKSIFALPETPEKILDFLINLTPGKKINKPVNRDLSYLRDFKKIDLILQKPEILEPDEDLNPKQLDLKKELVVISQHINFG